MRDTSREPRAGQQNGNLESFFLLKISLEANALLPTHDGAYPALSARPPSDLTRRGLAGLPSPEPSGSPSITPPPITLTLLFISSATVSGCWFCPAAVCMTKLQAIPSVCASG